MKNIKKKKMGYKNTVAWIALNDEPSDLNPKSVASYISTTLAADIFAKDPFQVGLDVVDFRIKNGKKVVVYDPQGWVK